MSQSFLRYRNGFVHFSTQNCMGFSTKKSHIFILAYHTDEKQAGAELGQAQLKLGLDFTLIFCRFGFSRFGLVKLVLRI